VTRRSANCPNCGAPVEFLWSAAVQTTCQYCRSVLVRHDVDLERVGPVGDLPPDASPIRIGTEGRYRERSFVVVGRILYEYERGGWNEWHVVLSDGSSGWLSDAQLEYAMSFLVPKLPQLPNVADVRPGQRVELDGATYQVTVVTRARYRGVEGELPFEYWDKSEVYFADLRTHGREFATIDYSEPAPLFFAGESVEYDELRLTNVREFEGWEAR
jgi:hypothetical protein